MGHFGPKGWYPDSRGAKAAIAVAVVVCVMVVIILRLVMRS